MARRAPIPLAAFIPSRRDRKVNELALAKVREDKVREAGDGFDGTWVAHPDLVPVAMQVFDGVLGSRPNQVDRQRDDVQVSPEQLLAVRVPRAGVTAAGLRGNVRVALLYLESWLRGVGAVGIDNLMEDVATAEIARAQIWQWREHGARLEDGSKITRALVRQVELQELERIRATMGDSAFGRGRFADAAELFRQIALDENLVEFLTLLAYPRLEVEEVSVVEEAA